MQLSDLPCPCPLRCCVHPCRYSTRDRNISCIWTGISPIVHHEKLQVLDILHHILVEACIGTNACQDGCPWVADSRIATCPGTAAGGCTAGKKVPGLLVGTIANVGHVHTRPLELPPDARVNTLWPPPGLLQAARIGQVEVVNRMTNLSFSGADERMARSRAHSSYRKPSS